MTAKDQYKVHKEPFYQQQSNEVALYEAAYAARLPVMIKGPTGCGKSRFVEYMAWKLNKPLITVACNEDMTASDLVGRYVLEANGTRWLDGPLTTAARIGAICYLDEIVEARQDTTVVIHPLTDHRRTLPLDKKGELLEAHPDFQMVISYNPGYQNLMKDLKQSTKQRFTAFEFDYPDAKLETSIVAKETGTDEALAVKLVKIGTTARNLKGHGLDEGIHSAAGLLPDLPGQRRVARDRVPVVELVGIERAGCGAQLGGPRHHRPEEVLRDAALVARDLDDLRAEAAHVIALLEAEGVGGDHCDRKAAHGADEGERRTRAAAGVLDEPPSRPQAPGGHGAVDDRQGHPVLHAARGVAALDLDQDPGVPGRHEAPQLHERRPADRRDHVPALTRGAHRPSRAGPGLDGGAAAGQ